MRSSSRPAGDSRASTERMVPGARPVEAPTSTEERPRRAALRAELRQGPEPPSASRQVRPVSQGGPLGTHSAVRPPAAGRRPRSSGPPGRAGPGAPAGPGRWAARPRAGGRSRLRDGGREPPRSPAPDPSLRAGRRSRRAVPRGRSASPRFHRMAVVRLTPQTAATSRRLTGLVAHSSSNLASLAGTVTV